MTFSEYINFTFFFQILSGQKYKVHKEMKKFVTQVTLNILNVDQRDFGTYECVAKNPLGESDGTINLSGMIFQELFLQCFLQTPRLLEISVRFSHFTNY